MLRTPSPPPRMRARTPPAPLHGARYDKYEPFSPRRSGRVAAKRAAQHIEEVTITESGRAPSPTRGIKATPPTLDLSPAASPIRGHRVTYHRSSPHVDADVTTVDADTDSEPATGTPRRSLATVFDPRGMLPTPAKTPRKRPHESEEALHATARRLFSNPPARLDDIMPTPRKNRSSKIGLFSLDDEEEEEKFEIYTDSKERVPTVDETEDNPFLSRKGKGRARVTRKTRTMNPVQEATVDGDQGNKGILFMFRGRKVFRNFEDEESSHELDEPDSSNELLLNQAEGHLRRPLTRSSITPRLLFQDEINAQRETTPLIDEEEALTDIEYPLPTPSRKGRKTLDVESFSKTQEETTVSPTGSSKRQITLDSWTRVVKSSTRKSPRGKKRGGDELQSSSDKRMRTVRP